MAVRKIRTDGDVVLRKKAGEVKEITPHIIRLLDDMKDTLKSVDGLGLAAPQIGISKALMVARAGEEEFIELINPTIVEAKGEEIAVEGCLSFPGVFGEVPRAVEVVVSAIDKNGNNVTLQAKDLLARIFQHEIDHLHGVVFVDKITKFLPPEEIDEAD